MNGNLGGRPAELAYLVPGNHINPSDLPAIVNYTMALPPRDHVDLSTPLGVGHGVLHARGAIVTRGENGELTTATEVEVGLFPPSCAARCLAWLFGREARASLNVTVHDGSYPLPAATAQCAYPAPRHVAPRRALAWSALTSSE